MAVFNSAVLTSRGNELLVDAVAGDKIVFTRMVVGCGEYSDEERERRALEKVTALKDVRQEFTFSAHKKVSEQCVLLTAVISNRELEHSYKITEIGIYGKRSGDEEDFLCSVAVTRSLEESDTFPPYNGLQECQIVQDYYVTISPDAEVSVNTQGACVLREELENFKNVIFNILDGKIDKAAVANNLLTTVEGYVLDARQGNVLKNMIDQVNVVISNLRESFRDGCKMIVDRLTALGYAPASPQGPAQIVDAINAMYIDRYNKGYADGRVQGRNDVIADPGAYGLLTVQKFYSNAVTTQAFANTGKSVETWAGHPDPDQDLRDNGSFNIPISSDKILYAITFRARLKNWSAYEAQAAANYTYWVKTVEGTIIQSGTGISNSTENTETQENITVDLLAKSFSTTGDHLVFQYEHRAYANTYGLDDSQARSCSIFDNITAKYK